MKICICTDREGQACVVRERDPVNVQYCLGRSSPNQHSISGRMRVPSPPDKIMAHRESSGESGRLAQARPLGTAVSDSILLRLSMDLWEGTDRNSTAGTN